MTKKKLAVYGTVALVLVGILGYSIFRVIPVKNQKMEVKYETGDRPLPQTVYIWVKADGGLYMRENPEPKAKIVILIPDGTKLEASEVKENWYKITYMEKTGWVNKNYVTTEIPVEEPTKAWNTYTNKTYSYSVRYPKDWVFVDYGENPATNSKSYIAFGSQLPAQLDPINLPPVIFRTSQEATDKIHADYRGRSGSVAEAATISALPAQKYTYNSTSGIQMTCYVVGRGATTFIIEETGGYADDLAKLVATINL